MEDGGSELVFAPSNTWVLRGGDLGGKSREKNLRLVYEAYGLWGICVKAEPDKTINEIALYGKFGNREMMTVLSDELVEDGFRVVQEPGTSWPNALLLFEDKPTDDDWAKLRDRMCSRGMTLNPTYQGK